MWRMFLTTLLSTWLVMTPMLWAHRPAQSIIAFVAGVLGAVFSVSAVGIPRLLNHVAVLGGIVGFSVFAFPDSLGTMVHDTVIGSLMMLAALAPQPKTSVVRAAHALRDGGDLMRITSSAIGAVATEPAGQASCAPKAAVIGAL